MNNPTALAAACLAAGIPLRENVPLSTCTTLRLGGPAQYFYEAEGVEPLSRLLAIAQTHGAPVTVIGRGSNLLVRDGGVPGVTVRIGAGMSAITRGPGENTLTAEAGASLGALAHRAADEGLAGLAFAAGIPGSVGGGALMNAGAYGGELGPLITRVEALRPDGTAAVYAGEAIAWDYRHTSLMDSGVIVTRVTFALQAGAREAILAEMAELNRRRAEKQPITEPSAGSTFKRPVGGFAAALIDQCGLKGMSVGGARVSEKHAGFLVNHGHSAADFLALMEQVRDTVLRETGIELEPEVRIIGVDQ